MWPFKKRVAGTEGPDSPHRTAGRGPSGDLAGVPAIERTVSPMPATIETASFQADLAAQRPPEQYLRPLSHGLSHSGPSGLIGGLVMPARRTEHAGIPIQRSAVKFSPRPAGRWVTSTPGEVDRPYEEIPLAGAGPATAYPAPEPTVQVDLVQPPAPEAPRPAAKPAGSEQVLMRVRSDALPMVRLTSTPKPASPTGPQPAPVSPAPTQSPSQEPPAADEGRLNTLGEPQELQEALPQEAPTPAPHSMAGEPIRRPAPIEAPVQRTAAPSKSFPPETGGRPHFLPAPPPRHGRPLGLGPPLRSYDSVEPAIASPPKQATPQESFRAPSTPALGTHTEAPAPPIRRSESITTQTGHSVDRDRPAPVQDPIAHDESAAAAAQRSASPAPELPLLGHPGAETTMSHGIDAPARQKPAEAPMQRPETTQPARLDRDRRPPAESPVPVAEKGLIPTTGVPEPALPGAPERETLVSPDLSSLQIDTPTPAPQTPSPKVQRLDAGPTEAPPPVNEAAGTERPTLGAGDPAHSLSTWEPAEPAGAEARSGWAEPSSGPRFEGPLTSDVHPQPLAPNEPAEPNLPTTSQAVIEELQEPTTVPLLGPGPVSAIEPPPAPKAAHPPETPVQRMLDDGSVESLSPRAETQSPAQIETPYRLRSETREPSPEAAGPELSGRAEATPPVRHLDAAAPAPETPPAAELVELPLLGRETETSLVEPTPEPNAAATAQSPVGGIPRPLVLQRDLSTETELPENRPLLGEMGEAPADRPLLGEPVAPELNPPQFHLPKPAASPGFEPVTGRHQAPIQRSSLVERARSLSRRGTQPDSEPAPRSAETLLAPRRAKRASPTSSFELPAHEQLAQPAAHTFDLPAVRTPSVQREPETPGPGVLPAHPTLTGDITATLQHLPDTAVPGTNTDDPLPTPPAPEWLPTPVPLESSENRRLVGQDQALTLVGTEPELPTGAPVQRSATAAPGRPGPLTHLPAAAPGRTAAGPEDHTTAPVPAGISELPVNPLGGPSAEFQSPTAQVPLVGAPIPTGLGLPASFPAPANNGAAKPRVQRSTTSPVGSADPLTAAAPYPSEHRTAPTTDGSAGPSWQRPLTVRPSASPDNSPEPYSLSPLSVSRSAPPGASPEPYSHRPPTVDRSVFAPTDTSAEPYSLSPLSVGRSAFAAPYRPDPASTPADRNGAPNVQRAPNEQASRELFVARAQDAAAAAIAAGVATRSPDGAPVFRSPEAAAPPAQPAPVPAPAPQPAPIPVQRTAVSAPPPAPKEDPEPQDLDELAMRLYPKLRPYLRKDLWLDRERSGLLADLR